MKAIIKEQEIEIDVDVNSAWKRKAKTYDAFIVIRENGYVRIWDDDIAFVTGTADLTDYVEVSIDEARAAFSKTLELLKV